jgi:GDP-4-dehydro-6-deoxy-D-mannose reductase
MRILITGITGFAGGHLAESLLAQNKGLQIYGASRSGRWPSLLGHLQDQIMLLACDLCTAQAARRLIADVKPDRIYHLAGYAHAGQSLQEPQAAWAGNLQASLNLYQAIVDWGGKTRVLYVGSGLIYGDQQSGDRVLDEAAPLCPATPYACSKAAADLASYQHTRYPGLDIVRVRPFNHIGPRQSPDYAVAHFAQQIAAIERGQKAPVLKTGNLASRRDLTDVRDTVRAYALAMEQGKTGECYNVGSGVAPKMQTVVDRLCALVRVPIGVVQDRSLMRSAEDKIVRADIGKIARELGWKPIYDLDLSLIDTLDFWRAQA